MTENELYHHGVQGMKWGVRRYQNEDGTYTEAGKRRRKYGNYTVSPSSDKNSYDVTGYGGKMKIKRKAFDELERVVNKSYLSMMSEYLNTPVKDVEREINGFSDETKREINESIDSLMDQSIDSLWTAYEYSNGDFDEITLTYNPHKR